MYKILLGLMIATLIIGALITLIGAAIGFFTNNSDMIGDAIAMILVLLLLGTVFAMVLGFIEIFL